MLKFHQLVLLLAVGPLTSCGPASSIPLVTPTALASPVATLPPTATPPTPTTTPSPVEPTTTSSVASPPEGILRYQRLDIAPSLPPDASPTGTLLLIGQSPYSLSFDQHVKEEIPGDGYCLSTSPDRKWFAYCRASTDSPTGVWLIVESADGHQRKRLAVEKDWWWDFASSWLDNERLIFNLWKDRSDVLPVYPVVVVNPFTGKWQEIASDYPDLTGSMSGPAGTIQFVYSTVVYDPSLNLVIYPQGHENVVLWDRQAQRALASIADLGEFQHVPLWSPDSKRFVIAVIHQWGKQSDEVVEEWFSISREGEVRQLTHFGDYFDDAEIGHANWSPDGRRLAFWLDAKPSLCEGQNLAVLELETQQVTDYCVSGSDNPLAQAGPPIWSPDSRYIVVNDYQYQNNIRHVILVDIEQGWAAQIGEDAYPVGWLTEP